MVIIHQQRSRVTRWVWRCVGCGRGHRRYRGETACEHLRCGCGGTAFVKGTETAPEYRG